MKIAFLFSFFVAVLSFSIPNAYSMSGPCGMCRYGCKMSNGLLCSGHYSDTYEGAVANWAAARANCPCAGAAFLDKSDKMEIKKDINTSIRNSGTKNQNTRLAP
jgi:hypothetical protein